MKILPLILAYFLSWQTTIVGPAKMVGPVSISSATTVADPTTSNSGGSCSGSDGAGWSCSGTTTVSMADATSSAAICYTTDGSTPAASTPGTCSHGSTYSSGISTASTTTYKMLGTKSGFTNSAVVTVVYTITVGPITAISTCHGKDQQTVNTAIDTSGSTVDCTGATAIAVWMMTFNPNTTTPTDSGGDTLTALTSYGSTTNPCTTSQCGQFYYICGPSSTNLSAFWIKVSAEATVYKTMMFQGFSGTATSGCLGTGSDLGNGGTNPTIPTYTPSGSGQVILAGISDNNTGAKSFSSSPSATWTITDSYNAGAFEQGALAYNVYNSTTPIAITVNNGATGVAAGVMLAFHP